MQLLSDITQDLRKQSAVQQAHSRGPPAAGSPGLPAGGNTKQTVLTSLLLPGGDLSWGQQLAAMRQELRVIVGKGLHSTLGRRTPSSATLDPSQRTWLGASQPSARAQKLVNPWLGWVRVRLALAGGWPPPNWRLATRPLGAYLLFCSVVLLRELHVGMLCTVWCC